MRPTTIAVGAMGLSVVASFSAAQAQDFYAGKQVRLLVSSAAGGGYDTYARVMQRHMPKYIAGNPTIIVVNMPGAGGLTAINHAANIAEKDGSTFGIFNRYGVVAPFMGNEQAKFKPETFNWLGTAASYRDDAYLFMVRSALPHRTVADMRNPDMPLHVGVVGTNVPAILKDALGLNFRLVAGYKGQDEMGLAFERSEIDGLTAGYGSSKLRNPEWFEKDFARPMIQFGRIDRLPELKDVPTARELARTPADRALIEFAEAPLLIAWPYAAPPGVPADRVAILRAAFSKAVADPGYIVDATKQKMELSPKNGEEVQDIIANLAKIEPAVVERYLKALGGKAPSGG